MRDIPSNRWDGPGLGDWDLRSLVGHTSRSLITVSTYLQTTAEREDITDPAGLLRADPGLRVRRRRQPPSSNAAGRPAGTSGDDPAATVDGLVDRVLGELAVAATTR